MCLGGTLAAFVTTAVGDTTSVVTLRNDVDRGTVIKDKDLMTLEISGDPTLKTVPAADRDSLVGQYAVRDLTAGSLVPAEAVESEVVPAEGETLVGVALTPGQLPATALQAGDRVVVVHTPRAQDDLPNAEPATVEATVVRASHNSETNLFVIDVTVPQEQATQLAQMVATGRVGLIVNGAS